MYDRTGRELGTAWRAFGYVPDAQWEGPSLGLLGYEPDTPALYTITAPISTPFGQSTTVTTFYFRTTFTFNGSPANATLIATNMVDDGLVIHLNGFDVGRLRVPANQTAITQSGGPAAEGAQEVVTLTNVATALRVGNNVLAVEVHNAVSGSFDMMFGMKLTAFLPTALTITEQPQSQTVTVGDTLNLTVGVSGGPVAYRWFKDGVFIQNATNATYSVLSAAATHAGNYRVVISNVVTVLTSAVATVSVVSDTLGPKMLSATIALATPTGFFPTNTIAVLWDEALSVTGGAQNTNNYKLVLASNPNIRIPITRAIYVPNLPTGTLLTVDSTNANWSATGNYHLIVNNIADSRGYNVNPNSAIGVSYLVTSNLMQMSDQWNFYDCDDTTFCDPDSDAVFANEAWTKTNYVMTAAWGTGFGIFARESGNPEIECQNDSLTTTLNFQFDPVLYRRTFQLPVGASPSGLMRVRCIFDDGMVIFLNGRAIWSNNAAGPITKASRSPASVPNAICTNFSITVDNLLPRTNWLAAAVLQNQAAHEGDTVFGWEMDLLIERRTAAPTNFFPGTPTFVRSVVRTPQTNYFVLSWPETNYGYALRFSTNIVDYGYSYRNGAPISGNPGPNPARRWYTNAPLWLQVSNQANPFTNPIPAGTPGARRFYQLYRERLND